MIAPNFINTNAKMSLSRIKIYEILRKSGQFFETVINYHMFSNFIRSFKTQLQKVAFYFTVNL